ncbi:hypothetical protein V8G54_014841 [Vigna mungo]|uniref:Uncharacterized protein n=1 Tax=Vigna mungo TaxID=3915 RepID=A0AAQ3NJT6_VIGMU
MTSLDAFSKISSKQTRNLASVCANKTVTDQNPPPGAPHPIPAPGTGPPLPNDSMDCTRCHPEETENMKTSSIYLKSTINPLAMPPLSTFPSFEKLRSSWLGMPILADCIRLSIVVIIFTIPFRQQVEAKDISRSFFCLK